MDTEEDEGSGNKNIQDECENTKNSEDLFGVRNDKKETR